MDIKSKVFIDLNSENFKRMKNISILLLSIGIFTLITDYSNNPWDKKMLVMYKILDIIFSSLSFLSVIYFWNVKNTNSKINILAVKITVSYLILWSVLVCGLDFSTSGFSTYITALLLSIFYLHFRPVFFINLIWISTFLFIVILYFSEISHSKITSIILVIAPISIISTLISYINYIEKIKSLELFYKNNELTEELKIAKESLDIEVLKKTKNLLDANIELEKSRNKIKLDKDRFEALINQLQQGVLYLNTKGEIIELNKSIVKMMGSPSEEDTK